MTQADNLHSTPQTRLHPRTPSGVGPWVGNRLAVCPAAGAGKALRELAKERHPLKSSACWFSSI